MTGYRFEGVCAVEAEPTQGRTLRLGALSFGEPPWPLTDQTGQIIGAISALWRDGKLIRCRGRSLVKPRTDGLGVSLQIERYEVCAIEDLVDSPSPFEITSAKLDAVVLVDDPSWPTSVISMIEEEGAA